MSPAYQLVLLRHGESEWNKLNLFTGWRDVPLTQLGKTEACEAGQLMADAGLTFDLAFTSVLSRAIKTLWLSLEAMNLMWLPVHKHWRLNERHYGALQGSNKADAVKKFGEAQVKQWRRGYATPPPPVDTNSPDYPRADPRYAGVADADLPRGESLKDVLERVLPYWRETVLPQLRDGRQVLIVAHGNSLRALVKMLDGMSESDIVEFNIPTGIPMLYELDEQLQPLGRRFLGDSQAIAAAQEAVRRQTEKK
jgi:2,3-bisphosphoglycerate-dependent phosphoglycerate mutase